MVAGDELDDIASIRERPGMFVGDVRTRSATHQLVWEVLANAVDEHLAGRCTRIELTLHADGSVSVRDDGAGISLDVDESGTPWVERVLTTRHFTATADGHAPHVHLRPSHHVGLCMVSALSSSLSAEVRRDGEAWRIELERVTPQLKMQILSDPKEWRNRLVNTKSHQQTVAALAPETYAMLDRLAEDMERTLVAVRKAEQKLNTQCQGEVQELADKHW